jgi:FkbM family methyltransferase
MGKIYVQIGAGAGDRDSSADYNDGFTSFVKSQQLDSADRIILIEPNPLNITALQECWQHYPQVEIHKVGIVPKQFSGTELWFYYTHLDAPHYQVASFNKYHVLKHYQQITEKDLISISIKTVDIESFVKTVIGQQPIDVLAIDIEGIDADVLLDTNIKSLSANILSFEHIHLGAQTRQVVEHIKNSGYEFCGKGFDYREYDWMFKRIN